MRLPVSRGFVALAFSVCFCAPSSWLSAQDKLGKSARADVHHAPMFDAMQFGPSVDQRKPNANGDIDLSGGMLHDYPANPNAPQKTDKELTQILIDRSALIFRATAESYKSNFTGGNSFLYSDWQFTVEEVFKMPQHQYVKVGDPVTVVRTGGALTWDGRHVIAHDTAFPAFVVGGEYVLFLTSIADDPNSYRTSSWGSFQIVGNKVRYLLDPNNRVDPLEKEMPRVTAQSFVGILRESIQ